MNLNSFKKCLGFKRSTYIDRMFLLFDEDCDRLIQFNEFLYCLNIISERGSLEDKLEFSFMIYDHDGDGKISKEELAHMLVASLEESDVSISPELANACVDHTISNIQVEDPNCISKAEYIAMVKSEREKGHDMMRALSVNVGQRIAIMKRLAKRSSTGGSKS